MPNDLIQTTQQAFSALRGHVAHGTLIAMENGDQLQLISAIAGWQLICLGSGEHLNKPVASAAAIESMVVAYPRRLH